MSVIRRFFRFLYENIFSLERDRTFNEQPTRPLDAAALARALAGEGRRHISTGRAKYVLSGSTGSKESLYMLTAHSEGLHAVPDFGIVGLANSDDGFLNKRDVGHVALAFFANQITKKAILDFLKVESFENSAPLQTVVAEALELTDEFISRLNPKVAYSLTAGLIFAEIMILGHRGSTGAYHIDRHHIEKITTVDWEGVDQDKTTNSYPGVHNGLIQENGQSSEGFDPFTIYSRPVPRDGYILLCSEGLWRNISVQTIHDILMTQGDSQKSCDALIAHLREKDINQNLSVILLYFPPDFGPWR
jgi:hypothetical protein